MLPVPFRNLPVDPRIADHRQPHRPEQRARRPRRRLRAQGTELDAPKPRPGTRACNLKPRLYPLQRRPLPADAPDHHVVLGRPHRALLRHVLRLGGRRRRSSPASRWCATRSASRWTTRRSPRSPRSSSAPCATGTTSGSRSSTCSDSARLPPRSARGNARWHSPVAFARSTHAGAGTWSVACIESLTRHAVDTSARHG